TRNLDPSPGRGQTLDSRFRRGHALGSADRVLDTEEPLRRRRIASSEPRSPSGPDGSRSRNREAFPPAPDRVLGTEKPLRPRRIAFSEPRTLPPAPDRVLGAEKPIRPRR